MHLRQLALGVALWSLSWGAGAVAAGEKAPAIIAPDVAGASRGLADFAGRVVYVDFWASWCAPCRESLPALQRMQQQWADQGFSVLAVNVDTDREAALKMMKQLQLGLPVVFDPEGVWAKRYALPGMPTGYLIGRDGVVRRVHAGYKRKDLPELEKRIAQELAGGKKS